MGAGLASEEAVPSIGRESAEISRWGYNLIVITRIRRFLRKLQDFLSEPPLSVAYSLGWARPACHPADSPLTRQGEAALTHRLGIPPMLKGTPSRRLSSTRKALDRHRRLGFEALQPRLVMSSLRSLPAVTDSGIQTEATSLASHRQALRLAYTRASLLWPSLAPALRPSISWPCHFFHDVRGGQPLFLDLLCS